MVARHQRDVAGTAITHGVTGAIAVRRAVISNKIHTRRPGYPRSSGGAGAPGRSSRPGRPGRPGKPNARGPGCTDRTLCRKHRPGRRTLIRRVTVIAVDQRHPPGALPKNTLPHAVVGCRAVRSLKAEPRRPSLSDRPHRSLQTSTAGHTRNPLRPSLSSDALRSLIASFSGRPRGPQRSCRSCRPGNPGRSCRAGRSLSRQHTPSPGNQSGRIAMVERDQ